MPTLAAAKAANSALKLKSPVSVVVGGTNGIGAALAVKLAEYSTDPTIHLVGRNATAAEKVIQDMKTVNSTGTYHFHQCDVTLPSKFHPLIKTLSSSIPLITHLILSPGIFTTQGRTPASPSEPNDVKMMLHHYARFAFIRGLVGSLDKAVEERGKGSASVISVLDSTRGDLGKIHWDDLDLRKRYSLGNAANHCLVMNDVVLQRFASLHPTVSFVHAYPALVASNIGHQQPFYMRIPGQFLLKTFGVSSSDCAEYLFAGLHKADGGEEGRPRFIDNHGDDVRGKKLAEEEQMDRIWKHSEGIVDAKPV